MLDEGLDQGKVSFGKTEIVHTAFADDLVIFANNDMQINQNFKILAEKLQKLGLQVNAEKKKCNMPSRLSEKQVHN